MKKLFEKIILSDAFVKAVVYIGAILFTLLFTIKF
jgi:hypothetical protein